MGAVRFRPHINIITLIFTRHTTSRRVAKSETEGFGLRVYNFDFRFDKEDLLRVQLFLVF